MSNFLDYLDWRGDLPFSRDPYNEVDDMILAELAYADLRGIVPDAGEGAVTLREAAARYEAEGRVSPLLNDPAPLLHSAGRSERFGAALLSAYADETDETEQFQFAALSVTLDDGTLCVVYRGTDDTIVGWREDFNISVLSETPGQSRAVSYLNEAAARHAGFLRVVGHSKGGNLAFYAAAFCDSRVKSRILSVCSGDGPGFRREVTRRAAYREIYPKLRRIVPESSVVGLLLTAGETREVVKSSVEGALQHNPYSWQVKGCRFVSADKLSPASTLLEETLRRWIDTLSDEQRANLVEAIFDSLEASGAATISELNAKKLVSYNAILRGVRELDPSLQRDVLQTVKKLALAGKDVLWDEARRSFEELVRV